jgi:hypothetical protein
MFLRFKSAEWEYSKEGLDQSKSAIQQDTHFILLLCVQHPKLVVS